MVWQQASSSSRALLRRTALKGFAGICEALYPDNDLGAPTWRDTEMEARAAQLWDDLPPPQRALLETLFAGFELGGAALGLAVGPFSRLPVERRLRTLQRMADGPWPLRFLAEAIKSSTTMVYMSHPLALAYIGATRACGSEASHGMPVKPNAFAGLLPRAERVAGRGAP